MRYLLALAVTALTLLGVGGKAWAVCPGIRLPLVSFTGQDITVSTTPVALTIPAGARVAIVRVNTNSINFYDDGRTPSTTAGNTVSSSSEIEICQSQMGPYRMTRSGATDSAVVVRYYGEF